MLTGARGDCKADYLMGGSDGAAGHDAAGAVLYAAVVEAGLCNVFCLHLCSVEAAVLSLLICTAALHPGTPHLSGVQARAVEQHPWVLHPSPECYQYLRLCASGWA